MKNLKISTKLYLTLILYSSVFIAVGLMWLSDLHKLNTGVERLINDQIQPMAQLKATNDAVNQGRIQTLQAFGDSTLTLQDALDIMVSSADNIEGQWNEYISMFPETENQQNALNEEITRSIQEVRNLARTMLSIPDSLAQTMMNERYTRVLLPLNQSMQTNLDHLFQNQVEDAYTFQAQEQKKLQDTRLKVLIIVLIMLIGPGAMAIVMIIGIGKSIRMLSNALNKMANGDLKIKFDSFGKDELGILMMKLEKTAAQLQEVIASVRIAAINMSHASNELSSVSQNVAQGASEQASTSEEIASSVEQMAGNIQQNTENAEATNTISSESAIKVQTVFESSKSSLERIIEIAEKVSIIGDIAFQTNILSLNAAVEAARAGEHGRGFGVVATEVGKLAERSKNAANEINELSKRTVEVTEQSKKLLEQLMPDIQKTSKLVGQISVGSFEQSQGANQVNIAIQQLSMVTQQNAASSEEMATSAAEMTAQAKQLTQTMSFFSIEDDTDEEDRKQPIPLAFTKINNKMDVKQGGVNIDLEDNDALDQDFVKF
ncbi:MAG: methyl-accepting chemotaxis protein [Bacteroidota bacterium]|nr:methyl-accepting chemotaxis protein [Bacteroidota bacterium]